MDWAELGGFIGYGPPFEEMVSLVARFAASLLRGMKPADLPVEPPSQPGSSTRIRWFEDSTGRHSTTAG